MFGDIFTKKYTKLSKEHTLSNIEDIAIKKVSFMKYAEKIVSKRGNIFKNNFYNIDQRFDSKLASYS